jgi:hypothetical protein
MVNKQLPKKERQERKRNPQIAAQIMRPEHPQWFEFYSRLREAFKGEANRHVKGEFRLAIVHILTDMGFSKFDCEMSMLYFVHKWVLQL